jgi:hypothetical protein
MGLEAVAVEVCLHTTGLEVDRRCRRLARGSFRSGLELRGQTVRFGSMHRRPKCRLDVGRQFGRTRGISVGRQWCPLMALACLLAIVACVGPQTAVTITNRTTETVRIAHCEDEVQDVSPGSVGTVSVPTGRDNYCGVYTLSDDGSRYDGCILIAADTASQTSEYIPRDADATISQARCEAD